MLSRNALVSAVAFSCLLVAHSATAQPRWGRERLPNAGACFYEDRDFRGQYFCVRPGDRLGSLPRDMADKISSMRLLGAHEVTVFRDNNWHGRSARFIGDVRDLKGEGWNDQISSIRVASGGGGGGWFPDRPPVWGNNRPPREGACFYEDANFHGRSFCVPRGATYTSLPSGFNDRISSIRVFGSEVRVFQDRNFSGRSKEVRKDTKDLKGEWRDTVSSIRVF